MIETRKWIALLLLFISAFVEAQETILTINSSDIRSINQQIDQEQKNFRIFIQNFEFDANIKATVENFAVKDIDALQESIVKSRGIPNEDRLKGLRSLQFFMNAMKGELQKKKFSAYKLPVTLNIYKQVLPQLLKKQAVSSWFTNLNWRSNELLANSFWQFEIGKWLEDLTVYKRVKSSPEYILSFLEKNIDFAYRDSLIVFFAAQYPGELLYYLKKNQNSLTQKIIQLNDPNLLQILTVAKHASSAEIVPFTEQLAKQQITVDSILIKRKNVTHYFQLLVNAIIGNNAGSNTNRPQKALQHALHEKSLAFYIKDINDHHNDADAIRFASVKSLRPQDLYYIIVSGEQDMYTSTYLGLYHRLIEHFKNNDADLLFELVHYDQFRKFLRIAANYNTILDFFKKMPVQTSEKVIHHFVADINLETSDEDELITEVMNVADAFLSISRDEQLTNIVRNELINSLNKNKKENSYHGIRIFQIFNQAYDVVTQKNIRNALKELDNYESIGLAQLRNKSEIVNEVVLFYGDEDGKNSYKSFMNFFKDSTDWKIENNNAWTTIKSRQGAPVVIFANLPLDNENKKDLAAQDSLFQYLNAQNVKPSVLIHRGHSYHLSHTLRRLNADTKLAILGSCGGYNNIKQIISASPNIQIIASKQVGSMIINDPLLDAINKQIKKGNDLNWVQIWEALNTTFKDDPNATKIFGEYVSPFNNVGVFVYTLYNADQ